MTVYDTTIFNGEFDLLEIRLNILSPFVDKFIIVEGTETFSGKWKPMYWATRNDGPQEGRFDDWEDKIINVAVQGYRDDEIDDLVTDEFRLALPFFRAFYQKECIRKGLSEAKDEDVVIYGDIDEIINPEILKMDFDKVYNLEQLNYCYYLNNRSSEKWVGTIVGKWGEIKTKTFKHWRATHTNVLPNGGWHFTSIGGPEAVRHKLDSYDHQEFATTENFDLLEERIEKGEDYLGRTHDWLGTPFTYHIDESELPTYLLENKERYKKLWK